jgi:hypothetical protein
MIQRVDGSELWWGIGEEVGFFSLGGGLVAALDAGKARRRMGQPW